MHFNLVPIAVLLLGLVQAAPPSLSDVDMAARSQDLEERGTPLGQRCPTGQTAVSLGVPATPNGCGTKAINVPDFSYGPCCNAHDICYSTCSKNKATCDTEFKTCMKAMCTAKYAWYDPRRIACNSGADLYYDGVHLAGEIAFDKATAKHCKCV